MRISISDLPTPVFEPGAPPVALPIPIAHTVLRNELSTPLAHEELRRPNQKTKRNAVAKHPALFFRSPSPCSVASSSETSDAETDSEMESLVKKPDGEAGRPGRGGYNLEDAVCLATKDYNHLKDIVHTLASNHLNTTLSFSKQKMDDVQLVQTRALEEFPKLARYEGLWPVNDLLKLRLKATASAAKKKNK